MIGSFPQLFVKVNDGIIPPTVCQEKIMGYFPQLFVKVNEGSFPQLFVKVNYGVPTLTFWQGK